MTLSLASYSRRPAPKDPALLPGWLDTELQNIERGILGRQRNEGLVVPAGNFNGLTDDTGKINEALRSNSVVEIPAGVTVAVDGMISVPDNALLVNRGTLIRRSSSSSTRPIVALQGNYSGYEGRGNTSTILSQKPSPDGLLLYGAESPLASAPSTVLRWGRASGGRLIGNGGATSKGLALQNMQAYGVGALYEGNFFNFQIISVAQGIYCNAIANMNKFAMINMYDIGQYAINVNGASDGVGNLTVELGFFGVSVDTSSTLTAVIRLRSCTQSDFIGVNAEAGTGDYIDADTSNSRLCVIGSHNQASNGTFTAPLSTYLINGAGGVGGTFSVAGQLRSAASSAANAGFFLPEGVAPTSPADGDTWAVGNDLFRRIGGVTKKVTFA